MPRGPTARTSKNRSGARRGPSRPPATRTDAPLRPTVLRGATEDLEDLFEEALRHRLLADRPGDWTIGPVRRAPLSDIEAGNLAWSAQIGGGPAGGPATPVGELTLILLPRTGTGTSRPATPPLLGRSWKEFAAVDYHAGPPRLLLLTRILDSSATDRLRSWTRPLFEHLVGELE